jgi:RHS repeat-associated protein
MKSRSKLTTLVIGIIFTMLAAFSGWAQKPSRQNETGIVPGMPYASSDIESINLTNGNLNFSFPLGSLPAGRGQATAGLFLKYNSKLWKKHTETFTHGNGSTYKHSVLSFNDDSGWKFGQNYALRVVSRNDGLDEPLQPCSPIPGNVDGVYIWKTQIEFPDGSLREFRPVGYSIPGGVLGNFYNVHPNGSINNGCAAQTQDPNPYRTYYSADSSYMRLIVYNNLDWELYMTDGSKITHTAAEGHRIYDRNGNFVYWGSVTLPNGQTATGWIDQFGRYTVKRATSPNEDTIYQMGFNGQLLETKVRWKMVTVIRQYQTECLTCQESGGPGRGGDGGGSLTQTLWSPLRVVDNVENPTGQIYTFDYYAHNGDLPMGTNYSQGWGEVKSITMPSTAKTEYNYGHDFTVNSTNSNPTQVIQRSGRVNGKTLFYSDEYDGTTTPRQAKWDYTTYANNATSSSVGNPDGTSSTQYFYDLDNDEFLGGYVYKEVSNSGALTEKLWNFNSVPGSSPGLNNPYVKAEFNTIPDGAGNPSLTAIKEFNYDKNGNVTQVKEYDWVSYSSIPRNGSGQVTGLPGGLTPVRISQTSFNNPTPDASDGSNNANGYWNVSAITVKNAAASAEVFNGSGVPVSRSEIVYDNPNTTANPVQAKSWDSSKGAYSNPLSAGNSISTTTQYNQYGMPTLTTDAKGVQTQITYGQVGSVTDLYPTQVKTAFGLPEQRTATTTYDFFTGLTKTATDVDNNVTNETVYDVTGRPIIQKAAINTPNEIWTQTEFNDNLRRVVVRADLFAKGDGKKVAIQHFDQLGRVRLSRTLEDAAAQNPYNEADGIKVQSRYLYDNGANPAASNGMFTLKSNPYRTGNEAEMGWTVSYSDKTGRTSTVKTYAGGGLPAPWGGNGNLTGTVLSQVDANTSTVTDQAGKQRRSITNGIGQLVRVDEPDDSGNLGGIGSPVQPTSYSYDTLNNLVQVNQGVQQRNFSYNSLSRLLTATNPESGTMNYVYDASGNLTQKTDARGVVTNYVYDNINRVTSRTYSDGTPTVSYTYDNLPNAKGRLTQVSSTISTTNYTNFDNLGRVLASQQITDGQTYNFGYGYNLSGMLVSETYPSGRVVTNQFEVDGDLAQVNGSFQGANKTYVGNFAYTSAGAIGAMQLGNGRWENTVFNSRLQPVQIGLGSSQNAQDLWKVNYDYGQADNNGNVKSQQITVPSQFTAIQNYTYDSLNRVKSANETISNSQTWKQTFSFDRYGNRKFDANQTTTLGNCPANICNPDINPANNRVTTHQFDNAGNTTIDAEGRKFFYDAENKQKEVKTASDQVIGQYLYDGDGKRVKKLAANDTTIFVYDAGGKLASEYTVSASQSQAPQTSYLTNDTLGSPRVTTDSSGNVVSRRDFRPYGEEIYRQGQGTDKVRQKFTGYQKDDETDLDFAEARMYVDKLGRFTSNDPLLSTGRIEIPQTWNRYSYVLNNPINSTDPLGMYCYSDALGGCSSDKELKGTFRYTAVKGEKERVDKIIAGRNKIRDSFKLMEKAANSDDQGLTEDQKSEIKHSIESFGKEYEKGVTIGFGDFILDFIGAKAATIPSKTESNIVLLDSRKEGTELALDLANEAGNLANWKDYQNGGKDMTQFETEVFSYKIESYTAQGLGLQARSPSDAPEIQIWNKGWGAVEREKTRSENIERRVTQLYKDNKGQPLTRANPGIKFSERKD